MLRALPILFLVPAALWTGVGGPLAAQQFPPGYVDPAPVLEAARHLALGAW